VTSTDSRSRPPSRTRAFAAKPRPVIEIDVFEPAGPKFGVTRVMATVTHSPPSQNAPSSQVPHEPPQPSSPHILSPQVVAQPETH